MFLSGEVPPLPSFPTLTDGILQQSPSGKVESPVGQLAAQGRVLHRGRVRRLNDVFGRSWMLLSRKADPLQYLSDEQRAYLASLGVRDVYLSRAAVPDTDNSAVDFDLTYQQWFSELGVDAVMVRPDFYVYGTASGLAEVPELIEGLALQLPLGVPTATV